MLSDNVKKGVLSYFKNKVGKYQCCFVNVGLESICDHYFLGGGLYYSSQHEKLKSTLPVYHIYGKQNDLVSSNHKQVGGAATLLQVRQTPDWQERSGALGDTHLLPLREPTQAQRAGRRGLRTPVPGAGTLQVHTGDQGTTPS